MQFSSIIATLSLALAATAAPALEARTGGAGSCTSQQYQYPVCCTGVTAAQGTVLSINILTNLLSQAQCVLGGTILGSICSQSANNLCCNQNVQQGGIINVAVPIQCVVL